MTLDCSPNMGGILQALLANTADVASITTEEGKVTGITMADGKKFHKYAFKSNTASMTSTYQVNRENGTTYVQTDLVMTFNRMETAKRIEISAIAQSELYVLVEDANHAWWLLGKDAGVLMSAGDGQTGTGRADRNGYGLTLQDESLEMPFEILVGTGGVDIDSITA